ncbi:hypothetical protein KC946_00895 [Candidatus Saccharibacteria bacterium]|nr:hypothetical protein [Candidatus Saccharibacteria bacterium]
MATDSENMLALEPIVNGILETIDKEREREIISRRFGLFDRKETLEQIGELLGITRERVRQLEKAVIAKLKESGEKGLPLIKETEQRLLSELEQLGKVARIGTLTGKVSSTNDRISQSRVSFIAHLSPELVVIEDNDNFYHLVGLKNAHSEDSLRKQITKVAEAVKTIGKPTNIKEVAKAVSDSDIKHVEALASTSKKLATLNGKWGLIKWPTVNPKNIRDKIYVILQVEGKPLHFNEIAKSIKDSEFKRNNVTTQAIHNELIKDGRFVLIGRGIYALKEWGYSKGTVADIISDVLKKAGEPLHRDEIVKRVLKSRHVKETTILLNLQGKDQFKRVAKATYTLAEG